MKTIPQVWQPQLRPEQIRIVDALEEASSPIEDALRAELRRRFPNAFYDPARHYMRRAGPKSSPPKPTRDD